MEKTAQSDYPKKKHVLLCRYVPFFVLFGKVLWEGFGQEVNVDAGSAFENIIKLWTQ